MPGGPALAVELGAVRRRAALESRGASRRPGSPCPWRRACTSTQLTPSKISSPTVADRALPARSPAIFAARTRRGSSALGELARPGVLDTRLFFAATSAEDHGIVAVLVSAVRCADDHVRLHLDDRHRH